MMPHAMLRNANSMSPVDSNAVGIRGTRPVSRNVVNNGQDRVTEAAARIAKIRPKKCSGLSALVSHSMVLRIRRPS